YAVQIAGESGCTRIGRACPSDRWSDVTGMGRPAVYVDPLSTAGIPDGSQAAPYRTIADAIGASPDDAIIALARGTYRETADVGEDGRTSGIAIGWSARVTIESSAIRALSTFPATYPHGIYVEAGAHVDLRSSQIEGGNIGIVVSASWLRAVDLAIRGSMVGL